MSGDTIDYSKPPVLAIVGRGRTEVFSGVEELLKQSAAEFQEQFEGISIKVEEGVDEIMSYLKENGNPPAVFVLKAGTSSEGLASSIQTWNGKEIEVDSEVYAPYKEIHALVYKVLSDSPYKNAPLSVIARVKALAGANFPEVDTFAADNIEDIRQWVGEKMEAMNYEIRRAHTPFYIGKKAPRTAGDIVGDQGDYFKNRRK